jgi:HK97 family phage prohead protease
MTSPAKRRLAGAVERTSARVVAEAKRQRLTPDELPALRLPWFEVRNAATGQPTQDDSRAEVFVFDEIGGSMGVDANDLITEIGGINGPINVRINSPGGSVFDAINIRSALLHHPHHVRVYVDALAASAASVIAMGGDEIVMMPGAQMMIHDASAPDHGNPDDHRAMAAFLDRQSDNIAEMYAAKAGGTADEWRARMGDETWVFDSEAVSLGLADRVFERALAGTTPEPDPLLERSFDLSHYRFAGREAAPGPMQARVRRSSASVREREAQTPTRTQAVGLGDRRNVPFPSGLRASLDARNGKDLYHVHGYATVFGKSYPMWDSFGEYEEVVMRGAADRTLMSNPDVAFLVNHGGVTMARTTNGTLTLSADAVGLVQDAWLNPERTDVKDLISAIEDELITEMSFAFMIPEGGGMWSEDFTTFEIRTFDIHRGDVSAVNYGASPWTSSAQRAREVLVHAKELPEGMQRAFAAKLGTPMNRRARQVAASDLDVTETKLLAAPPIPVRETIPDGQGRTLSLVEAMLKDD